MKSELAPPDIPPTSKKVSPKGTLSASLISPGKSFAEKRKVMKAMGVSPQKVAGL